MDKKIKRHKNVTFQSESLGFLILCAFLFGLAIIVIAALPLIATILEAMGF